VELRHIRYFIAVAEYLNFHKAADRLHIAQPPLSRQIRQLEESLGVELFDRDQRRVELTKAGHAFLEEARKLMAQAGHAAEAARQAQRGESGIIKVGIASGLGSVVSRVVFAFRKRWPDIEVECRDIFSNFQSHSLSRREIDVGFLRPPLDHIALDRELLYEEEFVVIVPKTHRLAKRRALRMHDIAEEPLILFDRNLSSGLYDKILGLYSRNGLTPRLLPRHVEAHEEAGAIMVGSGKAIFMGAGAIVNRTVAGIQLASIRLNEPEAKIEVYAAWRKDDASAAVHGFLECMRSTLSPEKHRVRASHGSVITSHFPRAVCDECSYARRAKAGR
jgi:DNA-binding transcriptional LysR family regulator